MNRMDRFHSVELPQLIGAIRITTAPAGTRGHIEIVRCYSTTFLFRASAFGLSSIVLVSTGALFAVAAGAWPVLVFCMLQAAVLARAWAELELHADDREFVSIDDVCVHVDAVRRQKVRQCRLQRYWSRVTWAEDANRLCLRSHGREVEIAAGALKEDKRALYGYLRSMLGTAAARA